MTAACIRVFRFRAPWLVPLALMLSGSPAEAHLITTGLGPVYDGISHFLMSPEDLVPAFALALLAGQCGPEAARRVLFVLPATWLMGGLAGLSAATAPPPDLTWLIFILLGGLVAAHLRPPGAAVMTIAALLGLFKGFINGSAMSYAGSGLVSLVGIAATVFIVAALAAAAAIAFTWPPAKIAFRVLGSWTAATGLLLLGWQLR
jgi:urease accessory protein